VGQGRLLAWRLRAGDNDAAEALIDEYSELIYLFMRRLGHGHQIAEDLAQETFLRAWHHIGQLRDDKALSGWLYRIAGNVSRVYWRRQKGRKFLTMEGVDVADGQAGSDAEADQSERLDHLRRSVDALPWKLRQAIVLHYMQHLTISEAARAADVREGTLKSRLSRGLEALRKALEGR